MSDCIFCKIVSGEIPNHKVYQDADNLAFLDITPCSKGHTMVIPKTHAATMLDLEDEKLKSLILAVKKAMALVKEKLNPDGFNVGVNHGEVSGQSVPHLHIHIIPRYFGDGGGSMHSIVRAHGKIDVAEIAQLFV